MRIVANGNTNYMLGCYGGYFVLVQFAAVDASLHDPVSRQFMGTSLLAQCFEAYEHGDEIPGCLRAAVDRIRNCPMDDMVNEGPHSKQSHIGRNSNKASWAWTACRQNEKQNFIDYDNLKEQCPPLLSIWNGYSSILRAGTQAFLGM